MPTIIENFKKGDLLYGLKFHQKQLLNPLQDKVGSDVAITVDEYNNKIIPRFSEIDGMDENKFHQIHSALESKLNDPDSALESELNDPENSNRLIKNNFLKSHYHFLLNATYQKVRLSHHVPARNFKRMDEEQRRTRKACKARMLDKEIQVHFLLDGIHLQHCFDRQFSLNYANQYTLKDLQCPYDSYTAAELRFLLKHYEEIKDHIKFYYEDNEIDLFKWLADHNTKDQNALLQWVSEKVQVNKITLQTQQLLQQAIVDRNTLAETSISSSSCPISYSLLNKRNRSMTPVSDDELSEEKSKKPKIYVPPPTPQRRPRKIL